MGTPEFAVEPLRKLVENQQDVVAVITVPDRKVGRGQKLWQSPVKQYALSQNIPVLQPEKLKNSDFIAELKGYNADLQVVVAFRMLPELVWKMPKHGTFNLHASLLPQYRGAAPINWAIINGEKETGLSTFFIDTQIDTGHIISQKTVSISQTDTAGTLHDKLMLKGADLVLKTVQLIENQQIRTIPQERFIECVACLKTAPKIFKADMRIDWSREAQQVYNFVRGLNPYPAAWSKIQNTKTSKVLSFKLFNCKPILEKHQLEIGEIVSDGKKEMKIAVSNGFIQVLEIQVSGKKRLKISDFLRGFKISDFKVLI